MSQTKSLKRPWEIPVIGPFLLTVGIFAISIALIWGIKSFILSADKNYKELIYELESKSFGNKWVAALELTKILSRSQIKEEDIPWLIEHLDKIYLNAQDHRTRHFVVAAAGKLQTSLSISLLAKALKDANEEVRLRAIVSLANINDLSLFDWDEFRPFLKPGIDELICQSVLFTYAQHEKFPPASVISDLLQNYSSVNIRNALALTLIPMQSSLIEAIIIDVLDIKNKNFNEKWAMNFLNSLHKYPWRKFQGIIEIVSKESKDLGLQNISREVLKKWGAT